MTVAIKSLGDGQLANSEGSLYLTPASTQAIIKTITLVNTDSSARTVNLYVKVSGGTSRRIIPVDLSLAIGANFVYDNEITLEAGDDLRGDASAATQVDYTINGIENT